jgi:hypothetical protein
MEEVKRLKSGMVTGAIVLVIIGAVVYKFIQGQIYGGHNPAVLQQYEDEIFAKHLKKKKKGRRDLRIDLKHTKFPLRGEKVLLVVPGRLNSASSTATVHKAWWELDESLQASPGDIDTVIFCNPESAIVGKYTNGATAYQAQTGLYSFDVESGKYLGGMVVEGAAPPKNISVASGTGKGDDGVARAVTSKMKLKKKRK